MMADAVTAVFLFLVLLGLLPLQAQAVDQPVPPRALAVPSSEIEESFLAYLTGLIEADVQFALDTDGLLAALPEFRARRGDPFYILREVARGRSSDGEATISFGFPGDRIFPLPVGLFGYHPISVSVSHSVVLAEQRFPSRSLGAGADGTRVLSRDYEYRVVDGYARFHFDDWLVFLTGGFLDDFTVTGVAIFMDRGEWRALLAGRGRGGKVKCWLFDLRRTRLILRVPAPLLELASALALP